MMTKMMRTLMIVMIIIIKEITEAKIVIEIHKIIDKITMTIMTMMKTIKLILKIIINNPIISKSLQAAHKIMEINQQRQLRKVKVKIPTKRLFPKKNSENLNHK